MINSTSPYLQPDSFYDLDGLVVGFSTRHGGVSAAPYASLNLGLSTKDEEAHVQANRNRLFGALGFGEDQLAIAGQVHGARIKEVTEGGLFPGYDALVTSVPGLMLCISAADCAAVLLADAQARVVGACHAGWRGTAARIAFHTVAAMSRLGAEPSRLRVYVSPCLSVENFEIGTEVTVQFADRFVYYLPGKIKPHLDMKAAIAAQLEDAGVPSGAIEVAPECTYARTDTFFSHRAEQGQTGRMMGFISLMSRSATAA